MMEKTLILKHISRMLCLLISYSKFTRTAFPKNFTDLHSCVRMYGMVLGIQGICAFLPLKVRTWNGGTYGTDHSDQECNKNFYR